MLSIITESTTKRDADLKTSLAKANVLKGLSATTHPNSDIQLEKLCQQAGAAEINGP